MVTNATIRQIPFCVILNPLHTFAKKILFHHAADNVIKSAKVSGNSLDAAGGDGKGHRYFWMRWLEAKDSNRVTLGEGLEVGRNVLTEWQVEPSFVLDRIERVKNLAGVNAKVG